MQPFAHPDHSQSTQCQSDDNDGAMIRGTASYGCSNQKFIPVGHGALMMDCGFPSDANFPHRTNNRPLYEDSTAAIAECRDGLDLVHTLLVGGFAVAAMVAVFGGGV